MGVKHHRHYKELLLDCPAKERVCKAEIRVKHFTGPTNQAILRFRPSHRQSFNLRMKIDKNICAELLDLTVV